MVGVGGGRRWGAGSRGTGISCGEGSVQSWGFLPQGRSPEGAGSWGSPHPPASLAFTTSPHQLQTVSLHRELCVPSPLAALQPKCLNVSPSPRAFASHEDLGASFFCWSDSVLNTDASCWVGEITGTLRLQWATSTSIGSGRSGHLVH